MTSQCFTISLSAIQLGHRSEQGKRLDWIKPYTQGIYAYVTLKVGVEPTEPLRQALVALVRKEIGPIASPDFIQWAPGLPKTRSGKIMRRILRKIADGDYDNLGDVSTLADPRVVKELIDHRIAH